MLDYHAARLSQLRSSGFSKEIIRQLGTAIQRIDHIGSTAVIGLATKPIIDIQISVEVKIDTENRGKSTWRVKLKSYGTLWLRQIDGGKRSDGNQVKRNCKKPEEVWPDRVRNCWSLMAV